ncbi:MAG: cob(I)yrinic acid a,c-diamide adenosyltransferase [Nitrospinota bacterium]|nr:cob(I)yrinic acid a,c-diamide adenosyltransferase [Nitrospinota bacterium]
MSISTRRGDAGETNLLYGGRVAKHHPRVEAYGALHEAVAALGLARAGLPPGGLREDVLRVQKELFLIGSELAADLAHLHRLATRIGEEHVQWLDGRLAEAEKARPVTDWVMPGEGPVSAAFHLASTIIRRAERRAVKLRDDGLLEGAHLLTYLNRLADLLFMFAVLTEEPSGD